MMSDDTILKIYTAAIPLILALMGVFNVIFPEQAWWIEHGMPKDTEPSDAGILFTRIGGVILIIGGIIFLCIAIN